MENEGRSLTDTPAWAVASVTVVMVALGISFHASLRKLYKWLNETKRKAPLAALEKIKDELMVFGVMSLLMSHWIGYISTICVTSSNSATSAHRYLCEWTRDLIPKDKFLVAINYLVREQVDVEGYHECPEGHEPFASKASLQQLHRFMFVLAVVHVFYSLVTIALAMIKISSWRVWENQAMAMAAKSSPETTDAGSRNLEMTRLASFIVSHASHPWSQHKALVWLLCFSRQFWSSVNQEDYMALRLGFINTHQLPLSYDFHRYMLRSMEEEFRDIVGISIALWIYAILCISLEFHGYEIYFWLSFVPAILILSIGTKLHRVVVKLAVEIIDICRPVGSNRFNLRDNLFWFGKPKLLLLLIQLISFQHAFEMASSIWSVWEVDDSSCFLDNTIFVVIRLTFGVVAQFWCSYITFPLYVIVTQMGARFRKSLISENVRKSLSRWQRRVQGRQGQIRYSSLASSSSTGGSRPLLIQDFSEASASRRRREEKTSSGDRCSGPTLWSLLYDNEDFGNDDDDDDVRIDYERLVQQP